MRRLLAAAVPAALLLALAGAGIGAAAPARADDGDYPISVDVVGDGSTDTGTGTGSTGSGSSGSGSGSGYGSSGSGSTGGDTSGGATGGGSTSGGSGGGKTVADLRGSLFGVDGLRLGYAWSLSPGSGWLDTSVVLHNGSTKDFPVTVRGWLTGPFGIRLGATETRTVTVKAGGTASVRLHLGEVGQWGLVTSHVDAVPSASVGGTPLKKVSREQTIFVVPWLICALLVVGGGLGYPLYRIIRAAARTPATAVTA
jgi:hypothetical protein